jgi:hypothetical protein
MSDTINVDVISRSTAPPVGWIPIINKWSPAENVEVSEETARQLLQIGSLFTYIAGTQTLLTGRNFREYFPDGGGGGGGGEGVTPEQVQAMINSSIDLTVSDSSTNAIQNKSIKSYVDTGLADKASTSSLAPVATSGSYNDLSNKPTIDSELSDSSTNAVQNKVITGTIGDINAVLEEVL